MDKETGAKGLSRSQAEAELKELTEQVSNDEKYIKQVSDSLAEKKKGMEDSERVACWRAGGDQQGNLDSPQ